MITYMKSLENVVPVDMHIETGPFYWGNVVDFELRQARRYPDDTLIFTDAYDMLFVGDAAELAEVVKDRPMLLGTTSVCWPHKEKAALYEAKDSKPKSKFCYVSGGFIVGKGHEIEEAILYGNKHFPMRKPTGNRHLWDEDNDQRYWTDLYLAGYGELDYLCELHQHLFCVKEGDLGYKDKRVYNLVTGSKPQFLHAAGGTWNRIPKELLP
jgi:hypothetical protein